MRQQNVRRTAFRKKSAMLMVKVTSVRRRFAAQRATTALLVVYGGSGPVWSKGCTNFFYFYSYHLWNEVHRSRLRPLALLQNVMQMWTALGVGLPSQTWGQTMFLCSPTYGYMMLVEDSHG